jgi:hypothetical protein
MKSILQEFPHSRTGPMILLSQLREAMSEICFSEELRPLLVWLAIIGAVLSAKEVKSWFLAQLLWLMDCPEDCVLGDQAMSLDRLFSLPRIFGPTLEDVWEKIRRAQGTDDSDNITKEASN